MNQNASSSSLGLIWFSTDVSQKMKRKLFPIEAFLPSSFFLPQVIPFNFHERRKLSEVIITGRILIEISITANKRFLCQPTSSQSYPLLFRTAGELSN
ncbi:hypothetical protein CEXT_412511 [Caerostris extrusa]|uniref:Uncharacterized protein n=1 Tax=Caerostris extrusa TaxID=172846 RepID=A0AAV4Y901_CAEEX|nr:hypothetical protein CEXT_412511 [Caerostris extrusa]